MDLYAATSNTATTEISKETFEEQDGCQIGCLKTFGKPFKFDEIIFVKLDASTCNVSLHWHLLSKCPHTDHGLF